MPQLDFATYSSIANILYVIFWFYVTQLTISTTIKYYTYSFSKYKAYGLSSSLGAWVSAVKNI